MINILLDSSLKMSSKQPRTYEGIRYIADKQVVVLDIGAAYTKFGFAGEATPRGIVRTEIKCPETKKLRSIFKYTDVDDLYQLLVEFLHAVFFKYVVITPKDVKLIVLESLLTPTKFRDTLAKVLFRHFEIASLMMLPSHLVTISTLGWDTALVLDVGYQDATLIPIYKSVPILKCWQSLPLAAEAVHERIEKSLKESIPDVDLDDKTIEDIKVKTCFVTTMERSKKLDTDDPPAPPPSVKYPGLKTITIPGHIREKAFELLWERDNDNLSIPTMILDSLVKCPIDTRQVLAENILLVGGTTMAKGFTARLKSELLALLSSDLYSDKLKIKTFKFHTAPCKPNYTVWLGGAIFGIADLPSRCILKETYLKNNRVPDWASLFLELVLALGNYVNRGNTRGNACGFRLASLNRLVDTKSSCSKGTTLLHYLVQILEAKFREVLDIEEDMPHVRTAARVSMADLQKEVANLKNGLQDVQREIEFHRGQVQVLQGDMFLPAMRDFQAQATCRLAEAEDLFQDMKTRFDRAVRLFGEDSAGVQPDEFFGIFENFLQALAEARSDVENMRKKVEEEERRAKQEQELKKRTMERKNSREGILNSIALNKKNEANTNGQQGDNKGEFDDLISALRTGDVFGEDIAKFKRSKRRPVTPSSQEPRRHSIHREDSRERH